MSQAILHLSDVYVSKGFNGAPQVKFIAKEGSDYGQLNFKVSYKKAAAKQGEKADYDNYSINWRNVKGDSKIIELLNQNGVKVSLYGEISQEEYEGKKFVRVTCDGRNSVSIAAYGENKEVSASAAPSLSNDDL
jgi:hypothetical protein